MKGSELRGLEVEELRSKSQELRRELFGARIRHATGQLENTAKLGLLRREIARIETVLRAKTGAKR